MNTSRVLLVGLLASACASTPAPPPQSDAPPSQSAPAGTDETVQLQFGWRPGDSARVTERRVRRIISGEQTRDTRILTTWRLEASKAADGLALHTRELQLKTDDPGTAAFAGLLAAVAEQTPLIVGPNGAALRLEFADKLSGTITQWVESNIPADRRPPQLMQTLQARFSPKGIEAREVEQWNLMVAFWHGGELELGAAYHYPNPQNPEMEIGAEERVPCREGEAEKACVKLRVNRLSTPALVQSMREQVAAVANALLPGAAFDVTSVRETIYIVTEPKTLKPHEVERARVINATVTAEGQRRDLTIEESTVREFAW
ncbi:MAG: hypothetical protein ACK4N5_14045 [Myxococcales bacterium]